MVFTSNFITLLLIGVTLWLWRLSQAQIAHLAVFHLNSKHVFSDFIIGTSPRVSFLLARSIRRIGAFFLAIVRRSLALSAWVFLAIVLVIGPILITYAWVFLKWDFLPYPSSRMAVLMFLVPIFSALSWLVLKTHSKAGWKVDQKKATQAERSVAEIVIYCGEATLPKEIYEGDSQNISLILDRESFIQGMHPLYPLQIEDIPSRKRNRKRNRKRKHVTLTIQETDNSEQFLEVQLLAAGFSTKGEEKQRQSLSQERLEYRWNCCFQNAGNFEFSLVLKMIHPSGERSLGAIEQTIRVNHLDHMTQHQVRIAAVGAGTVALLATAANLLSTVLGIWHLH